eukprot:COSAG02_NODE_16228_length_1101_cov_53.324351_1_plen_70_part_01
MTAKGVPSPPHKRSPLSLKEESRWPPWDSVLKTESHGEIHHVRDSNIVLVHHYYVLIHQPTFMHLSIHTL